MDAISPRFRTPDEGANRPWPGRRAIDHLISEKPRSFLQFGHRPVDERDFKTLIRPLKHDA